MSRSQGWRIYLASRSQGCRDLPDYACKDLPGKQVSRLEDIPGEKVSRAHDLPDDTCEQVSRLENLPGDACEQVSKCIFEKRRYLGTNNNIMAELRMYF